MGKSKAQKPNVSVSIHYEIHCLCNDKAKDRPTDYCNNAFAIISCPWQHCPLRYIFYRVSQTFFTITRRFVILERLWTGVFYFIWCFFCSCFVYLRANTAIFPVTKAKIATERERDDLSRAILLDLEGSHGSKGIWGSCHGSQKIAEC